VYALLPLAVQGFRQPLFWLRSGFVYRFRPYLFTNSGSAWFPGFGVFRGKGLRGVCLHLFTHESTLTAIEKHKSLPAGQAENYASKFAKGTSHLNIQQDEQTTSLAFVEPNLQHFSSSRKKAMTGLEAAEEEEAERRRRQKVAAVTKQAENTRNEYEEAGRTAEIAEHWCQSQSRIASLEESPSLSSLSLLSPSSDSQNDNTGDNFLNQDGGLCQSGCVRRPTRAVQSQDAAAQQEKEQKRLRKGKDKRKGKGKQKRDEKLKNTSQLIEDYCIDLE
jgi:hypothetical protein